MSSMQAFPICFNPFALRKAKIVYNFGLSECKGVKNCIQFGLSECKRVKRMGTLVCFSTVFRKSNDFCDI